MWKSLFSKTILERSHLIKEDCIKNVKITDVYSATIKGSKEYQVTISKDFSTMKCSCPCDGFYCKHLAAFMFYLEKHYNDVFKNYNKMPLNKNIYTDDFLSNKFKSIEEDISKLEKLAEALDDIENEIRKKDIEISYLKVKNIIANYNIKCLKREEKNNEKK